MVKILTDMGADIPAEVVKELNIEVLPYMIVVDGKPMVADMNLAPEDYYEIIENCDEIPTTSQMSPADIEDFYRKMGKENPIVHITMSGTASGINSTSNFVANQLNEEGFDITVVDSTMLSYTMGNAVVLAAEMARDGKDKQEIIDAVNEIYKRDTAYFLVEDMSFLKKGGRIKATTMAISKVLDIKAILTVNDGLVEAISKVRGIKKALNVLADYVEERMDDPENNEIVILNSCSDEKIEVVEELLKERVNAKNFKRVKIGPVITTHVGTGIVALYFKHKKPYTEY